MTIYDKTDKAREEISTRKHGLPHRLRSLLVMVDGRQTAEELLRKVAGIGLDADSVASLVEQGFIRAVSTSAPAVEAPVPNEPPASAAEPSVEERFLAAYQFYTETIKNTIGLRGYALQLKVEKATSIEELRQLRHPYLEAVAKAKGNEVARSMRSRLDPLLMPPNAAAPATVLDLRAAGN